MFRAGDLCDAAMTDTQRLVVGWQPVMQQFDRRWLADRGRVPRWKLVVVDAHDDARGSGAVKFACVADQRQPVMAGALRSSGKRFENHKGGIAFGIRALFDHPHDLRPGEAEFDSAGPVGCGAVRPCARTRAPWCAPQLAIVGLAIVGLAMCGARISFRRSGI